MAALCGLETHDSVADVLAGRRTVHEVLQRGPAGVQLVPGAWGRDSQGLCSAAAQQRLIAELHDLGRYAELVIVDVGSGISEVAHRFWQAADLVLLVTTPEPNAIMDAYACVKVLGAGVAARVLTLVNAVGSTDEACQVHLRLAQACQRFLGRDLLPVGHVPHDGGFRVNPGGVRGETGPAAAAFDRLAESLLPLLGEGPSSAGAPQAAATAA
jgi:flagellar biosynthesis protein FlhG